MKPTDDSDSWIDRVADAKTKRNSNSLVDAVTASYVQQYEASVEYLSAINRALREGKPVSVWEVLDAAIGASTKTHPFELEASDAILAWQNKKLSKEDCSRQLSQAWAEVAARKEALNSLYNELLNSQLSIESHAHANNVPLDKSRRLSDWRKFAPLKGR